MRVASAVASTLVLGLVTVASTGCKPKAGPCMTMGQSELLKRAAVVRLDVYPPSAHCDGSRLAAGAPPPTQSQVAAAGSSIHLDVPAGSHVLLLSAYADAAAAVLIGTACTEASLKADTPACFNLTLTETPDAAISVGDGGISGGNGQPCNANPDDCPVGSWCGPDGTCAPGCRTNSDCTATSPDSPFCIAADHRCVACQTGGDCPPGKRCSPAGACVDGCDPGAGSSCAGQLMCCSNLCLDTGNGDILNCGGCGRACLSDSAHGVAAANCAASLCRPSCLGGFADCTAPPAPQPDDGCETNIHDPMHCGGCNNVCSGLDHVQTYGCPDGKCSIASCASGFIDCDSKPANGCECPTIADDPNHGCCPSTGSNPGGCSYEHSTGFGQSWIDCLPLGTYTADTATAAAAAYDKTGTVTPPGRHCDVPGHQQVICNQTAAACVCFVYAADAGTSYVGRAHKYLRATDMGTASCGCALGDATDVLWK